VSHVSAPFRVIVHTERDIVRICPLGDVDIKTAGEIRQHIETSTGGGAGRVVLDLRGVTFLDSAGLHLVFDTDAASRADGWEFALIGGPAQVQRIFDLTGSRASLPFVTASQLAAMLTAAGAAPK
jgi:anti-sigma B factor antagonist